MPVLTALTKARELISDPVRWTQGEMARDSRGEQESACSEAAVKWCALGAIIRTAGSSAVEMSATITLNRLLRGSIAEYNDTHSHSEVLALFDAAIASFTAQGDQPPE